MLIGLDFPKISFEVFGFHFLEPNGFIGNVLLCILALYYYNELNEKFPKTNDLFIKNWRSFYLTFSICFLLGGFGHLLFNYTGVIGKAVSWYLSILSVYFIERATFSLYNSTKQKLLFEKIALIKMIAFMLLETCFVMFIDISHKTELGLIIPSISLAIGLIFCLGILGKMHQKHIHDSFRYQWISVFVIALSMIIQILKINIHPYFDRNDLSHLLLMIVIMLYYRTVRNRNLYDEQKVFTFNKK